MKTIKVYWWCDDCSIYVDEPSDEHDARHEFEIKRVAEIERLRAIYEDSASTEGDFSGASYDEDWGGR